MGLLDAIHGAEKMSIPVPLSLEIMRLMGMVPRVRTGVYGLVLPAPEIAEEEGDDAEASQPVPEPLPTHMKTDAPLVAEDPPTSFNLWWTQNWTRITCRYIGHRGATITRIQLKQLELEWKLETLNFLTLASLRVLDLSQNHYLHGSIPTTILALSKLTFLDLSFKNLTVIMPLELGNLSILETLLLNENQTSGSIPAAILALSKLTILDISANNLTGTIPSELGNLTMLYTMLLHHNQISGSIPPSFKKLLNLNSLAIFQNFLVGSYPPVLGNLTKLKFLYLGRNNLIGSIPYAIGNLVNMIDFQISSNQITGPIQYSIGNLTKL
ncbi:probable leucine-rich repeat receptor-like protein kinase At1g35710 [Dioscorea cayenensis subsp. rotundata]|uniref:Probable leucine-rich repeat receptor-like protein kinase At1g35710 n=1 Tax=Dioscorea cayennensis subsp. rotundata TaxID=55577 RepID=A0AB40ANV5_DIOCR|nr:probable leucine-rich repeat receptor-like protein kinase At1g35710 [Dioscorea cayenensis subsp. rotundata]